jgi:S-formylglutathione hydrolase
MSWSLAEVAGKPAYVFDPPARPRFAVLSLHGYGGETLAAPYAAAYQTLLAEHGLACVCPDGGRSWWLDRVSPDFDPALTPERYLLDGALPAARERWGLPPRAVGLLGVSVGGAGALRLAFRHPDAFPVVAAVAPTVDAYEVYGQGTTLDRLYDSREQCRQDTAPTHIQPHRPPPHIFFCCDPDDAWHRGNDRLHEKFAALGVPHECDLSTRAGGHSWAYFNHMAGRALRFLVAALEQEGRRLL